MIIIFIDLKYKYNNKMNHTHIYFYCIVEPNKYRISFYPYNKKYPFLFCWWKFKRKKKERKKEKRKTFQEGAINWWYWKGKWDLVTLVSWILLCCEKMSQRVVLRVFYYYQSLLSKKRSGSCEFFIL